MTDEEMQQNPEIMDEEENEENADKNEQNETGDQIADQAKNEMDSS